MYFILLSVYMPHILKDRWIVDVCANLIVFFLFLGAILFATTTLQTDHNHWIFVFLWNLPWGKSIADSNTILMFIFHCDLFIFHLLHQRPLTAFCRYICFRNWKCVNLILRLRGVQCCILTIERSIMYLWLDWSISQYAELPAPNCVVCPSLCQSLSQEVCMVVSVLAIS